MASGDLIDFNVIESHKENIEALPSGRSAKALAQLYSPPPLGANPSPVTVQDAHAKEREPYEKELANIEDADDPLDVYDRYVKWTLDTYPSPQARQTQLLPLLERATKSLQSSAHYKNDPRYLKLWLHYIRLFSDAPREIFAYLARHNIGEGLALYYEEFAAWLESAGRWKQAEEVYKMGLEREARPAERLMRKFGDFERRKEARPEDATEPTSPAVPTARPALAAKADLFATSSPAAAQQQARSTAAKKSKSSKLAIFSDAEEPARPDSGSRSKGWDNIGTIAERKKENSREAKPWTGETLKGGKTNGGMEKLMVFKDEHVQKSLSSGTHQQQCAMNPKTKRLECVFVNLEAVYPDFDGSEYCFEELQARHRGWLDREWSRGREKTPAMQTKPAVVESKLDLQLDTTSMFDRVPLPAEEVQLEMPMEQTKPKQRGFKIFEDTAPVQASVDDHIREERALVEKFSKTLALNDENDENAPMPKPSREADLAKRIRREERANRTRKIQVMDVKHIKNETKTIQLNLDSPTGPKIKRKKSTDKAEPTMTINTKEALDEIYGIFNQPLPSQTEQSDAEEEDSEDDYTTGDESTATGKLSGTASEYGDETRNELLEAQEAIPASDPDGQTNVTGWSDFTTSKHMPGEIDDSAPPSAQSTTWEVYTDSAHADEMQQEEELVTPQEENPRTQYVPMPPEDYEASSAQYRDAAMLPNHRLPFMTPIVEQTESSFGVATVRTEKDYFHAKTPSRKVGAPEPLPEDDEIYSSPFQEIIPGLAEDKRKVLQPIRTKTTKGTIALGQGTAKSQLAAKSRPSSSSASEPVQKGPLVKDEQCNPMDPSIRQTILSQLRPSLTSYEGYHEHLDQTSGRTAEMRKYVKTLAKASRSSVNLDKTAQTLSLPPMLSLPGAEGIYTLKRQLGEGTFAPVYLIENSAEAPPPPPSSTTEEHIGENRPPSRMGKSTHRTHLEALKMEDPPSTWEFYMLRQSHRRLGVSRASSSIVRAHEMHLYRDECFLIEDYRCQGTLLDLLNIARLENISSGATATGGGGMDEMMAMWISVELLRTVEGLHSKQLIHGDLKGDNVLVRFDDPGVETDWSPTYFPSGAHGWASKGISLIDFGRGIDMRQFVPGVAFIADWKTTEADCAEMRELRPWTYQIDYHGLAGIIHSLLFGKYMETIGTKDGTALGQGATKTYRIRESLKRYWQTEIWAEVFELLLNPLAHLEGEEGGKMPVLRGLRGVRERMEGWLEEGGEKGVGLKGMIGRMEMVIRERKRKGGKVV
ncbi:protein kinase [Recurvomyces mirabilis]|uniref:protein kinase n=1 Tax=Recurvomyces mirabilis TaxID=574656 RepID=UPI002DE0C47B|nr:protein kinase [Recurvomyces mirabilis]